MTSDERAQRLRNAAELKSADARARVLRALVAMRAGNKTINFNTVAAHAGVSKQYLYKQLDLREQIALERATPPARVAAHARGDDRESMTRQKLHLATEAIRRLKAEVSDLRTENAQLRGDLIALQRRRKI